MKGGSRAFIQLKRPVSPRDRLSFLRGFTLVELILVVMIMGALGGIAIPRVVYSIKTARHRVCRANVVQINNQTELWHKLKSTWPEADLSDIARDPEYFPSGIPVCPASGYNYWLLEDTHRIGGHRIGDDASHKELGYMTTGDITRDSQGNIVGRLYRILDRLGNQKGVRRYSDYVYDEDGNLLSYTLTYYSPTGEKTASFDYSDFVRDALGRDVSYQRVKKDVFGTTLGTEIFQDITYHGDTKLTASYSKTQQDATGNDIKTAYFSDMEWGVWNGKNRLSSYTREDWTKQQGEAGAKRIGSSEYTYHARDDWGAVVSYTRVDKDAAGGKRGTYDYTGYQRDAAGNVTGLRLTYSDSGDAERAIYDYSGYSYDEFGRVKNFTRTQKDTSTSENIVSIRERSGYTYNRSGYVSGYTQTFKNAAGQPQRINEYGGYAYDTAGRVVSYTDTYKDSGGRTMGSVDYMNSSRDAAGRVTEANKTYRDASGNKFKGLAESTTYDDAGRRATLTYAFSDASGQPIQTNEYTGYRYNSDTGRYEGCTLQIKDKNNAVTQHREYTGYTRDENGYITAYNIVFKNTSNPTETLSSREYRNFTRDSSGRSTGYNVFFKNGSGGETGHNVYSGIDYYSYGQTSEYRVTRWSREGTSDVFKSDTSYSNITRNVDNSTKGYDYTYYNEAGEETGSGHWGD